MDMTNVSSSNLSAVGYDKDTSTMRVQFNSGAQWDYQGVPQEAFAAVRDAASPGAEFNARIKKNYQGAPA